MDMSLVDGHEGFVLYHMHYMFPQGLQAEEGYSDMHRPAVGRRKLAVFVKGNSRKIHSDTRVFGWGRWVLQASRRRNGLTLSMLLILSSFGFYFDRHIFSSCLLHFTLHIRPGLHDLIFALWIHISRKEGNRK